MKKYRYILLFLVSITIIYLAIYINIYKVNDSKESVQQFLNDFVGEEYYKGKVKEIIIWNDIDDSNTWVAKFQFENGEYGSAQFEKGWNKKLKFKIMNNEPNLTYTQYETNKGIYGVVSGINADRQISKIKVLTNNKQEYSFNLSEEILFMEYINISVDVYGMQPAKYVLYNKEDNVIDTY